jgi:lysophospholipase L1-like esterase
MRAKSLLQNLALAGASLAFSAGVIEVGARVLVARDSAPPKDQSQRIGRYHRILGWDKPPGGHMRIARHQEYDIEIQLNSHGLRGPERDYAKPPGTRRVLILGDSFAEGYYVDEDKSAAALLEALLKGSAACGSVEVINGATAGYSTDQEYLFFEGEGKNYRPDVVLLFFYYNDLFFNTSAMGTGGKPKPYFDVDGGRLVLRNTPVPELELGSGEAPRPLLGSLALRLLSKRMSESPRFQAALARLGLVAKSAKVKNIEFAVFGPRRDEVEEMWRRTAAILAALKRAVEANGGRLAVLYVPTRIEANDDAWAEERAAARLGSRWDRARVRERLSALGQALGIPVSDPTSELRRAEQAGRPAYFPIDGHWNTVGNAVVARFLEPGVRTLLDCPGTAKR